MVGSSRRTAIPFAWDNAVNLSSAILESSEPARALRRTPHLAAKLICCKLSASGLDFYHKHVKTHSPKAHKRLLCHCRIPQAAIVSEILRLILPLVLQTP
jgi:hypothetical protein